VEVLEIARGHSFRIFFMRHMSLPTKLAGVFQLRQAMAWQRVDSPDAVNPWFLRGSSGFELAPELGVRADEAIFDKLSMSAFEGTPLAMALRDCGLLSFMICGIATEIGIDPTVRHGADLGFIPIVIEDACGHGHIEAAERSIENIHGRFLRDQHQGIAPGLGMDAGRLKEHEGYQPLRSTKKSSMSAALTEDLAVYEANPLATIPK
jgi:nicotinamidase-related amidase